jgi:hypothetical protein
MQPNALLIRQTFIVVKSGCYNISLFIDIGYIYIGIEQMRPFEEVSVGEMFRSVGKRTSPLKWTHKYFITLPLEHLSYMSQCQTLRKTMWEKSEELYDLRKTW